MITEMTALDALIVATIFLPFILLARIGKKPKKRLYKHFMDIAQKNGLNITEKEFWANSYIGIDSAKKILLLMRTEKDSLEGELVDLNNVKECKVITSVKTTRTKKAQQNILERVDLQICFTGKDASIEMLNFYDRNLIYSEDFEVKRAEKWKKLIEEHSMPAMATVA